MWKITFFGVTLGQDLEEWGGTLTTRIPRSTSEGKSVVMQPNVRAWILSRFVQYVAFQRIMGVNLGLKA